jgi:deazaflavin-dependent oxidoreductase (nitroreductase family)
VTALPAALHDLDVCYLTTTGRRSGDAHTIEIWFAASPDGARVYLLAGGVRNLQADGRVLLRVGDQEWRATASVIDDVDEREVAATLVFSKYQPRYSGDLTGWRAEALPVAITLGDPG